MNRAEHGKPLLLTMGDPAGIGPEIIARAASLGQLQDSVVVASVEVMRRALQHCALTMPVARLVEPGDPAPPGCLAVWQPAGLQSGIEKLPMGRVQAACGQAAALCIQAAAAIAGRGSAAALVTAPIHKEALSAAGVPFPGHTEMLQSLAAGPEGAPPVRMMLANPELRVVLVTIHLSLRLAIDALDQAGVLQTLRIAHSCAIAWGIPAPRIAVAGLNPHAGEGGLFGDEEVRIIAPAISQARSEGINALGPFAPDTVFMRARNTRSHPGEFDIVVAMVHDHGLIPVKYLGVEQGVNVTLGLPFVRTSPDHGTAFDIAGTGQADPASLIAAVQMARRLCGGVTPWPGQARAQLA